MKDIYSFRILLSFSMLQIKQDNIFLPTEIFFDQTKTIFIKMIYNIYFHMYKIKRIFNKAYLSPRYHLIMREVSQITRIALIKRQ